MLANNVNLHITRGVTLLSLTKSVAWSIFIGAEVEAGQQDGMVVLSTIGPHQHWLPGAETVEGVVCMVSYGEPRLKGLQDIKIEYKQRLKYS